MIQITCKGNSAICTRTERLTSGMVGLQCEFVFDGAWDGLAKTAVFLAGNEQRDVLLTGAICTVPWEVLQHPGYQLTIGVYGSNADGTLVIPTVYAMCGSIGPGADPSGDESVEPTLPVWGQMQGMIGNLSDLATASKDNLVSAINEAAQSGGGSGGITEETDPTVPAWAKAPEKPSYTAEEVGALPVGTKIPQQVQSDLSQNDNTAADYVKHRTHYEEMLDEYVIFEGTLPNNDTTKDLPLQYAIPSDASVTAYYNGSAVATAVGYYPGGGAAVGTLHYGFIPDLDLTVDNITMKASVYNGMGDGVLKFAVADFTVVHPLDKKYIPDDIARVEDIPDMTAYRTAEAQDVIDAGKQETLIQSGAAVGQIAKITAVDDSGKPTTWEAVDMPSGGGGWDLITDITLTEDGGGATSINVTSNDKGEDFEYRQCMVCLSGKVIDGWPKGAYIIIELYESNKLTGSHVPVSLTRLAAGAGGTDYKTTVEMSIFGNLVRTIACGGSADTSSLIIRNDTSIDTFRSIKITSYGNNQWVNVPLAAGGRVVIYGRK